MSTQMIGSMSDEKTFGTLGDVCLKLGKGVITPEHLKRFANKQNPFAVETVDSEIVFWAGLYAVVFELDARRDLLKLNWPPPDPNFWDVPMVKGLTETGALDALKRWNKFPVRSYYDDPTSAIQENDRHPSLGTYGVRFHAQPEGDESQKNISANKHRELGTKGNTLLEAEVLEPLYFLKSGGNHLNRETVNHAVGSRFSGGYTPSADWYDKFSLYYGYHPGRAYPNLRARVAVVIF